MGTLFSLLTTNMIKIAIVVCCAAEAEADPAFPFSTSGYGVPQVSAYNNYRGLVQPQAWTAYTAALRAPSVRGYTTFQPAQPYGYATVGAHQPQGHVTVGVHQPYGYAASGRYVANSVGAVHFAKRSAEAEPEAEAEPQFYGYSNYGYTVPAAYNNLQRVYSQPGNYNQVYTGYFNPAMSGYRTYSFSPARCLLPECRGFGYQSRYHY